MSFRADWAAPFLTYDVLNREGRQTVARDGSAVNWFDIEPCFIRHVVNAYEKSPDTLEVDVVRYPCYFKRDTQSKGFLPNPLSVLWRYTIDVVGGNLIELQLDDLHIELPRINESCVGYPNRYLYAVEQPSDQEMRGVVCYDLLSGTQQIHQVSPGDQNSEPIFVPKPGIRNAKENDGYILVCLLRQRSNTTEIRILDATDISKAPLATVALGRRVPAGFHGAWISAAG